MAIHIPLNEDAQSKLKKDRQKATLFSFLISLLVIVFLGITLKLLFIFIPSNEVETIISYQAPSSVEDSPTEPTIKKQTREIPNPPAASSALANVITTSAPTAISVPDTNLNVNIDAPDFGSADDFGMVFGMGEAMQSASFTSFGTTANTGLEGRIYDLKQSSCLLYTSDAADD